MRWCRILGVAVALVIQSGCVNREIAWVESPRQWDSIRTLHVVKFEPDRRDLQLLIADQFRAYGFSVTADPEPNPGADAEVVYRDHWAWDLVNYMAQLTVVVREADSNYPIATGKSLHGSVTRKTMKGMVKEVVSNIVDAGN
jgi:hypothetical protein